MSLVGDQSAVDLWLTYTDIGEEVDLADNGCRNVWANLRTLQSAECLFFV